MPKKLFVTLGYSEEGHDAKPHLLYRGADAAEAEKSLRTLPEGILRAELFKRPGNRVQRINAATVSAAQPAAESVSADHQEELAALRAENARLRSVQAGDSVSSSSQSRGAGK